MTDATENNRATTPEPPRRKWLVYAPFAIFAALAVMFGLALVSGDPSRVPSALIGKPAPQQTLPPLEGLSRNGKRVPAFGKAELTSGRPAIVNFWASWCAPCREEHPQLIALARQADIGVFGINYKDTPTNGRRFLEQLGNPFRAVGTDRDGTIAIDWGVYGMPETFVVSGDGTIIYKWVGAMTPEDLETKIRPAIAAARAKARPGGTSTSN